MRPAPNKEAIVPRKYRCTEQGSYCSTQATFAVLFHARCRKNEVHVSTLRQNYPKKAPHVKKAVPISFKRDAQTRSAQAHRSNQRIPNNYANMLHWNRKSWFHASTMHRPRGYRTRRWPFHSRALSPRYKGVFYSSQRAAPNKGVPVHHQHAFG